METTVVLVDDHPLFRKGLRALLEETVGMRVVGEAGDGQAAIEVVRECAPDVVIMDITMPGLSGVDAARAILVESPDTKVIALSIHSEKRFIEQMLQAGAAGYILKESAPEELVEGIRAVIRGEVYLSAEVTGTVVSEYVSVMSQLGPSEDWTELSAQDSDVSAAVKSTKLQRPRVTPDLVPRPLLLERIEAGRWRPLTLVSAAAGFGKSTLLSSWLEGCDWPHAWVSLDGNDNDLTVLLSHVISAIRTIFPGTGRETLALLKAPPPPPSPVIARSLLNELNRIEDPFILVLDDYHTIHEAAVHELLAELLTLPAPALHLVIASRRDPPLPILSLHAKGLTTEFRSHDLRFSRAETSALLRDVMGLEVDEAVISDLDERVQGWVTGLRLAALSARGTADAGRVLSRLQGDDRYVREYLVTEVLSNQPPVMQNYLLRTSILDRFCAPLCEAVGGEIEPESGGEDGRAFVDWLDKGEVFVVRVDDRGEWYRYQPLFQQLLQKQLAQALSPEDVAELHCRASVWFAENGSIDEAIKHALAAGDITGAVEIVEQNRLAVLDDDRWYVLEKWLSMLPDPIKQQRPELLLAQAWVCVHHIDFETLPPILERAENVLDKEEPNDPVRGEIDFLRGYFLYFQAQGAQSEECLRSAVEKIPETRHHLRGEAELHYALALHLNGRGEMAVHRLNDLLRSEHLRTAISRTRLWAALCFIRLLDGDLPAAAYPAQRIQDTASRFAIRHSESWGLYTLACIHFQWNDLHSAAQHLEECLRDPYLMYARAAVDSLAALTLVNQITQGPDKADQTMKVLYDLAAETDEQACTTIVSSCQARLSLLQGDIPSAARWRHTADLTSDEGLMLWWVEVPRITECRVLIAEGSGASLQQAVSRLKEYEGENKAAHNTYQMIDILSLLALAYHKQEQADEALEVLRCAVALAERGGFIRPFVELGPQMAGLLQELAERGVAPDFLNRVLAAFHEPETDDAAPGRQPYGSQQSAPPALGLADELVESLTEREMQVLELLAKRLTNKEIARELFISPGTVKGHTNNIYGKLGIEDRRQAVARAREIGLLPPDTKPEP